ncbi:MAG: hypothetical protein KR126chlam1_00399 [Chlamydiae bacterium]|nr:hypothetical protein [Chlamydiota bacterium]
MQTANWALQAGRSLQRKQTGFVHYCAQSEDGISHDTIPVLENALFALALFRTRLADNVLEGKALLERLLPFEVEGNFPVYLHEFPQMHDPFLHLRLLPVLFWVRSDFAHVIGDLKERLDGCMEGILQRAQEQSLPRWAAYRCLAFEGKLGPTPQGLFEWGEALISLQIAEKRGLAIEEEIAKAYAEWHPDLHLYTGPALRRHQRGSEPDLSLFDLFLSEWQKDFPMRGSEIAPLHLRGALIRPLSFTPKIESKPLPYIHFDEAEECPLFIGWKGERSVHTFALAKRHLSVEGSVEEIVLTFPEERPDTDEKRLEINFFLDHHPDHEIFVQGAKATTFQMGDEVEIRSDGAKILLSFSGEGGKFFGHILRGNRPSQHCCTGKREFAAYDWRIAIRTVSREKNAIMRVQVHLQQEPESQPLHPSHASHYPHKELSP